MNTRWSPLIKQIFTVGSLVGGVWLLYQIRFLLAPLILALLLAYLISFPVNWIVRQTGWPRAPVVAVVEVLAVLVLATAPALIVPWLISLISSFGTTLVNIIQELLNTTPEPITLTPALTIELEPLYAPLRQTLRDVLELNVSGLQQLQRLLAGFAGGAAAVVVSALNVVIWAFFILVTSFYVVRDGQRLGPVISSRLPDTWRPELSKLWRELVTIWDSFVRGQMALGLVMGIIVWLSMTILGVRNAPALGVLSGLLEFIPAIGPTIAAVPGVLIALILGSTWLPLPPLGFALLVGLVYALLSQLENIFLLPRVVGRRVDLHPVVVIMGALAGARLAGVLGILFAAPTIAAARVLLAYGFNKLLDRDPFPEVPPPPPRQMLWHESMQKRPVRAVLFDLDGTLIETDDQMVDKLTQRLRFLEWVWPREQRKHHIRRWMMQSEGMINGLITVLDAVHLDGPLSRLNGQIDRWRGIRPEEDFLAVPGSPEMLRSLAQRYRLGIVTSRSRREALAFLGQYGLANLFRAIITRDDTRRLKPHPMPVRLAAEQIGVSPAECVLVGDTSVDVRSAKTAGALSIGVLCGFGEEQDFQDADLVLESPAQVGAWL